MEKYNVSINADPEDGSLAINVDGHDIGIKIVCYYDEDGTQILDVMELIPGGYCRRIAFIAYGQETKIYNPEGRRA
jgi:hypothetical protein